MSAIYGDASSGSVNINRQVQRRQDLRVRVILHM